MNVQGPSDPAIPTLRFGPFALDVRSGELRKHGLKIRLHEQPFQILLMLLRRPGGTVLRDEIRQTLWPADTTVEFGHSINAAVQRLRESLGDSADRPRYVETVARRGYRFIGTLEPLADEAVGLMPGTIISHYRILAEAGRGAMGVVYKAEDTTLGRMVALKFLPDELATQPPALERLRREARMIAAMNHPGICTMHELGEASGRVFLVMEFLEGESLGERRARKPLSEDELFDVAVQVAKALEAAHREGMVHRDIKPDNMILTKQDVVKVMDFGLAKLVEEQSGGAPQSSLTGTTGYMSPEQMRGEPLDARSDIYSLGKVLEELAGESPPKILVRILSKMLAGDPTKRWQSAGELQEALEGARRKRRPRLGMLVGLATGALVVVALTWFLLHPPKPSAELTQKRLTSNSSENPIQRAVISPDGKYLAYSDGTGIKAKLVSTGEERIILRPVGVPAGTFWSVDSWFPDGTQLLADATDRGGHASIWTVSVFGQSPPRQLRDGASGFEVSPDGTHIAFSQLGAPGWHRDIWVMGSQGENAQKVLVVGENEGLQWTHWSPDGQRLAYLRGRRSLDRVEHSIETCDLKRASRTVVLPDTDLWPIDFCWLQEGRIIYVRPDSIVSNDGNLWQIGIDNHAGKPTSKPKRITPWAGSRLVGVSASVDGKRLVLLKQTSQAQAYVGELATKGTRIKLLRRLTSDEANDWPTAWTADSKAVLFVSDRDGTWGILKQGISQETAEPVVTGPQDVDLPRLSPDGNWILFLRGREWKLTSLHPDRVMRIPATGGAQQFVLETRNYLTFECARAPASLCVVIEASQDRKQVMITAFEPLKKSGKLLRSIAMAPLPTWATLGLSPDGSTVAVSRPSEPEIHIRLLSLSGGSDREFTVKGWPNITGLDWSTDGKGLYCGSVSPQVGTLLYVDLNGNARVLWQYKSAHGEIWGVPSPDGRYLAIQATVTNSNVWMLEGF